ncbi:MAG: DoxX family protein [Campylobacteraceae bacterium]|jgi:putative oxidoreductase|nr:DoxX family protein [Campylobacteraceae bacterium]
MSFCPIGANANSAHVGKLILRLLVGGLMFFHGINKIVHGVTFIKGLLATSIFPEFFAYGVYVGEILAPILLIIGFKTRLAALVLAINMLFVIFLTHTSDIFSLTAHGGLVLESVYFYLFASAAIFFLGGGKYSIDKN